jgi:hypothetical protein
MFIGAVAGSFALIVLLHFILSIRPTFQLFVVGGVGGLIAGGALWKLASRAVAEIVAYRRAR